MTKVLALVRATWLTARSYRMRIVFQAGGIIATFVPLYFVAGALQPVVQESIAQEGQQYFGFLIVGLVVTTYLSFSMGSLSGAISSGISTGTLEALLGTPTRLPTILIGMMGYRFLLITARSAVLILAIWIVGTPVAWANLPLAALILGLIVLTHLPVGLLAAALHLVFRTSGPLTSWVLAMSTLLGGVYYSTTVIPEIVRPLSAAVPLTYGLRALRRTLLSGEPLSAVWADVGVLLVFAIVLLTTGMFAFRAALDHARRAGTLSQY